MTCIYISQGIMASEIEFLIQFFVATVGYLFECAVESM